MGPFGTDEKRKRKIWGMLNPEAGQKRTEWLHDTLEHYTPPALRQRLGLIGEMNPVNDIYQAGGDMRDGDYAGAAVNTLTAAAPLAATPFIKGGGKAAAEVAEDVLMGFSVGAQGAGDAAREFVLSEDGGAPIAPKLPNLRGMPVDDAIRAARRQPHLKLSGDSAEGLYVGGPRSIKTRQDLTNIRREADRAVARGADGGDWYDRYRDGVTEVTGGNPGDADWMTAMHGQYSAGVSPEDELGFTLRDLNSGLATGDPVKSARPAQQAATRAALASSDPTRFQLGKKTGEYARRVHPKAAGEATATGVNDFRHARTLGYTEIDGTPQRNAIGDAGHNFADYETALMVDRANKRGLSGRSDWTGEQIQAAPWVAQKADDFYGRRRNGYLKKARESFGDAPVTDEVLEVRAKEIAFAEANRTITDFFPKHTAYGTYEAQPFVDANHLPGLANADEAGRAAFANDPLSGWTDSSGRDAIYSGYREPGTGYAMRVRPSIEAQGVYTPPGGAMETNPAMAARPLVAFESSKAGHKLPSQDRALLDAAEATRAYVDVRGAGAWHKPQFGGIKTGDANMVRLSRGGAPAPSGLDNIDAVGNVGAKYGLPDVVDTGDGLTVTNFMDQPDTLTARKMKDMKQELQGIMPEEYTMARGRMDSGYLGFEDAWTQGDGAATRRLMETLDSVPDATVKKLDQNPAIPKAALDRMARDESYAAQYGATRADIQNARKIIGEGPGWVGRLRSALQSGAVLPAIAAPLLMAPQEDDRP